MHFADELVSSSEVDVLPSKGTAPESKELRLATQLIDSLRTEWDPRRYRDSYSDEVKDLIKRQAAGQQIVVEEGPAQDAKVLDLMTALEASLQAVSGRSQSRPSWQQKMEDAARRARQETETGPEGNEEGTSAPRKSAPGRTKRPAGTSSKSSHRKSPPAVRPEPDARYVRRSLTCDRAIAMRGPSPRATGGSGTERSFRCRERQSAGCRGRPGGAAGGLRSEGEHIGMATEIGDPGVDRHRTVPGDDVSLRGDEGALASHGLFGPSRRLADAGSNSRPTAPAPPGTRPTRGYRLPRDGSTRPPTSHPGAVPAPPPPPLRAAGPNASSGRNKPGPRSPTSPARRPRSAVTALRPGLRATARCSMVSPTSTAATLAPARLAGGWPPPSPPRHRGRRDPSDGRPWTQRRRTGRPDMKAEKGLADLLVEPPLGWRRPAMVPDWPHE